MKFLVWLSIVSWLCLPGWAAAAPIPAFVSYQEGVSGYSSTQDTFIESGPGKQGNVNGALAYLGIDGVTGTDTTTGTRETLLKFEDIFGTGPTQMPPGSTINSATLTVYVENTGDPVFVHRLLSDWNESDSYSTVFGDDGVTTAGSVDALATATGSFASNTLGFRTIDVTDDVTAWLADPSSNFGWAMLQDRNNPGNLTSSEGVTLANRPLLSIDYLRADVLTPEPSTWLLMGVVLVGFAAWKFRLGWS